MGGLVPSSRGTINIRRRSRFRVDPVTGVEQLTGFQDHFDDVFITVILGTLAGIPMEEEDVHFKIILRCLALCRIRFGGYWGRGRRRSRGGDRCDDLGESCFGLIFWQTAIDHIKLEF